MILFPPIHLYPFAYIGAPTKIDLWEKQEAHEIHIELSTLLQPQKWNWAGLFFEGFPHEHQRYSALFSIISFCRISMNFWKSSTDRLLAERYWSLLLIDIFCWYDLLKWTSVGIMWVLPRQGGYIVLEIPSRWHMWPWDQRVRRKLTHSRRL